MIVPPLVCWSLWRPNLWDRASSQSGFVVYSVPGKNSQPVDTPETVGVWAYVIRYIKSGNNEAQQKKKNCLRSERGRRRDVLTCAWDAAWCLTHIPSFPFFFFDCRSRIMIFFFRLVIPAGATGPFVFLSDGWNHG